MIPFLKKLWPATTPPALAGQSGLTIVREKILQSVLLGLSALGVAATIIGTLVSINRRTGGGSGFPVVILGYLAVFLFVLVSMLNRQWPIPFRTLSVSIFLYLLALSELLESGLLGEARIWLLVFTSFIAIVLGLRASFWSIGLSTLTLLAYGLLATFGKLDATALQQLESGTGLAMSIVLTLFLSVTLNLAISTLIEGLSLSLREREATAQALTREREDLEQRITQRTDDLQRRLTQSRTAAEISRSISRMTDPTRLLQEVVDLMAERFKLYYVGVFLIDETGQVAVLRAGTGEAGRQMLERQHRLAVGGTSMIGWCVANRKPRIALDIGEEAIRFTNPLLPLTRSELALPILSHGRAVGALTVQSDQPSAFDQNDIVVLEGISDSLASAIENTRLVEELRDNLDELRALNRSYLQQAWESTLTSTGALSKEFRVSSKQDTPGATIELPLALRDQAIGLVKLESGAELTEEDYAALDAILTQTALALENARLVQETERRVYQEEKLNDLSTRLSRAGGLEEILITTLRELGELPMVNEISIELGSNATPTGGNGNGRHS